MKSKLVQVYKAQGEAEAQFIKGLLENHGIHCLMKSRVAPSIHVFVIDGLGEVKIMVDESVAEEARRLISEDKEV